MTKIPCLYPHVCLQCFTSFKRPNLESERLCEKCGNPLYLLTRYFKAPKKNDVAQWEKVKFLVERGYSFGYVTERKTGNYCRIPFPKTLEEAKEFIKKYAPPSEKIETHSETTNRARKRTLAKKKARKKRIDRIKKAEYRRVRGL